MTTASPPIDTFQDLLDALEREPRLQEAMRRYVLDQEFLQLPAIVHELAQGQARIQQAVAANTAAIAELKQATAANTEAIAQNSRDIAELKQAVAANTAAIAANSEAIAQNSRDIAELRQAVAENTAAIAQNSAVTLQNSRDIAELNKTVARLAGHVASISGKVDNLNGSRYEQKVASIATRFARRVFGMSNAVVRHRGWRIGDLLEQAANSERLIDDEAMDLLSVDIVISGQLPDGVAAYVVGEISLTVQERDIGRAARRARLLKTTLDDDAAVVHAAAFGETVEDSAEVIAGSVGVQTIIVPDYDVDSG